jgi:hypothetical protein
VIRRRQLDDRVDDVIHLHVGRHRIAFLDELLSKFRDQFGRSIEDGSLEILELSVREITGGEIGDRCLRRGTNRDGSCVRKNA